jgi:hypothetical protein
LLLFAFPCAHASPVAARIINTTAAAVLISERMGLFPFVLRYNKGDAGLGYSLTNISGD